MTVHHTNIFRDQGVYFLVLIRGLAFATMVWLTYKDVSMKGFQYRFFTNWGAYSTLVFFGLMLIVSLQKLTEHANFSRSNERRGIVEEMLNRRDFWYLDSFTAWFF